MIRVHPGMLRLVGLYCAFTHFCMGRKETEDRHYGGEREKRFTGQLSKMCSFHPPHSQHESNQEGGDDTSARTEKRSVSSRMLQVVLYSQEGPITSGLTQQGRGRKPDQPAGFRRRSPSALDDCLKGKQTFEQRAKENEGPAEIHCCSDRYSNETRSYCSSATCLN